MHGQKSFGIFENYNDLYTLLKFRFGTCYTEVTHFQYSISQYISLNSIRKKKSTAS